MPDSDSAPEVIGRASHRSPDAGDILSTDVYAVVFEHMLVGVAYHRMIFSEDVPQDYLYLYANPAFHTQTGLGPVVGKRVSEVIPGIRSSDPQLFEIYGRVAKGGGPEQFETCVEALQRWFAVWVFSPKPEHFVAVFDDITERKRGEIELRDAQERLSLAQRTSRSGVWDYDAVTRKAFWSPEHFGLFGLDPATQQVSMKIWETLLHPEDRQATVAALRDATHKHHPVALEYRIIRPSGEEVWIGGFGNTTRDAQGRPLRALGISIDITARKREELKRIRAERDLRLALRQVEQKERSRSRFLAATSHDLRQPLYAAQLFLNALGSTRLDGQQSNSVKKIQQALTGMASQLQSLLDQSRQEDALVHVLKRDTPTTDLFESMADIYVPIAQQANVRLLLRPGKFVLHTDSNLLSRLLGNLIDNAIKFSPRGTVLVCARRCKGGHLLQVRDNGRGMADLAQGDAFDDIYPIGSGERAANAGYGLGLSIVSALARLLGSKLRVASAPGKGSVFSLVVPG